MRSAKSRQRVANFGQIVTCFRAPSVGYELATEVCRFLSFGCLSTAPKTNEKALQITEFAGLSTH